MPVFLCLEEVQETRHVVYLEEMPSLNHFINYLFIVLLNMYREVMPILLWTDSKSSVF